VRVEVGVGMGVCPKAPLRTEESLLNGLNEVCGYWHGYGFVTNVLLLCNPRHGKPEEHAFDDPLWGQVSP